jgi:hypothetical protein
VLVDEEVEGVGGEFNVKRRKILFEMSMFAFNSVISAL